MANYYDILGVSKGVGDKELRQAFRRLARKHHPDLNPGDEVAEEKFKEINEAYEVLSEPESRSKYDRYGDRWRHADQIEAQRSRWGGGGDLGFDVSGGLEDLLGQFSTRFGRGSRASGPRRIEADVDVTLEEAFTGAKRYVTVTSADGERRIEVTIPKGVDTDSVVRVSLDKRSKLLLKVKVSPHARFQRKGPHLHAETEAPFEDMLLGGEAEVQTLTGRVRLKVPAGSQNGSKIRLAGQGMPKLRSPEDRGDLYVTVRPRLPKDLTDEERGLIENFKELRSKRSN